MTIGYPHELEQVLNRIDTVAGFARRIDCGPGWFEIIKVLDKALAGIDPDYKVQQVKEESGLLDYHCSLATNPRAKTLIDAARTVSGKTCERCGKPGKRRLLGTKINWLQSTLCKSCYKNLKT